MARRRRSLIGEARKASQRVGTDGSVSGDEPASSSEGSGASGGPPSDPPTEDLPAEDPPTEESPQGGPPSVPPSPFTKVEPRTIERAGMTIVPDADDLDDYFDDDEQHESFDIVGEDAPAAPVDAPPTHPAPIQSGLVTEGPRIHDNTAFIEADTQQHADHWAQDIDVEDAEYVETGRFAEDTTDHGWNSSVYGGPATLSPELNEDDDLDGLDPAGFGGGYMDLSDGECPPTEELPSAVMEDLSQVYNTPMSVPEPPPVPGIVDRYTPPPMARRGPSTPETSGSNFTPSPAQRHSPATTQPVPASRQSPSSTPVPDLRRRVPIANSSPPTPLFAMGIALGVGVLAVLLVVSLVWLVMNMSGTSTPEVPVQPVPREAQPASLDPSDDPLARPGLEDGGLEDGGLEDGGLQGAPSGVDAGEPQAIVAPTASPVTAPGRAASTPSAAPAPRPAPRAAAAASTDPTATNGTLSIESNRRVIISINGRPYDFTPLELAVPPGGYTISAALPSRDDSTQSQQVELQAGERRKLVFQF